MDAREIQVPEDVVDARVDRLLAAELQISRRYAVRLIKRGLVQIEGALVQKGTLLRPGERLAIAAFRHPDEGPEANSLALPLLAASDSFLAFDKPAGMPSLPLDFEENTTAVNAALAQYPDLALVGDRKLEAGLVHRLDTQTSGVLVFARNDAALGRARDALAAGRAHKEYRARVEGTLRPQRIELALSESGKQVRTDRSGRISITEVLAVIPDGDTSLVDVLLVSGLRHQIRVVLAHLGNPIVGDALYGNAGSERRHWLHASRFEFEEFKADAPPPPELAISDERAP